jgi:hypothetical protein
MHRRKPPTLHASIAIEMACHAAMGIALGLGFSFVTLAIGVGAALTGFVFTMMEKR